jgi:hypothetical protein
MGDKPFAPFPSAAGHFLGADAALAAQLPDGVVGPVQDLCHLGSRVRLLDRSLDEKISKRGLDPVQAPDHFVDLNRVANGPLSSPAVFQPASSLPRHSDLDRGAIAPGRGKSNGIQ